ncbi:hypothetical protein AAF712_015263 [Marasmius tenuissimus]|uniref:Uncharacterized protein n=1 Tax=Marasmius tenuissimus TaxID=585030 RepID=A0ABR2ZA19_9AGAR
MRSILFLFVAFFSLVTGRVLPRAGSPAINTDIVPNRTRLILFFEHNENLTFQEFSDYVRGPHAKLFLGTKAVRQNLLRYEQAFNNKQCNDTVISDTHKFAIPASGHAVAVKVTSVVNKLPDDITMLSSEMGVIRKDVQRLVGYFLVDTPGFMDVVKSVKKDKEVLQYELNTLDPVTPAINNLFGSFKDWDAVNVLSGRNMKELVDILKNSHIGNFIRQDVPNFVDLSKEIDNIPCDVVSYKIPPPQGWQWHFFPPPLLSARSSINIMSRTPKIDPDITMVQAHTPVSLIYSQSNEPSPQLIGA